MTLKEQQARSPLGLFHDWKEGPRPQRANLPLENEAIVLFADLVKSLKEIRGAHDLATTDEDVCDCELCEEITGILYTLEIFEAAFTGGLLSAQEPAELVAAIQEATTRYPHPVADPEPAIVQAPRTGANRAKHYWEA